MKTLKNINSRLSFPIVKIFAILATALILSLAMGYDCHAEISQEKPVSPEVRRVPEKKTIKRAFRVKKAVIPVKVKPAPQPTLKIEEAIEAPKYEVEISEAAPIRREYRPLRRAPHAIPLRLTREDIRYYLETLKYGETIDDMEHAVQALGSSSMRGYINANDPIINDIYNALVLAFGENDDEILLREIVQTLGKLGKEEAGNIFVNYLSYGEYDSVKSTIIRSLGRLKYRGAVYHLIRILQTDNNRELRVHSASALGMIGDSLATYPLISALNDNDRDVRKAAINALGNIGAQEAKPPLTSILNYDNDLELREEAARALRKIESAAD